MLSADELKQIVTRAAGTVLDPRTISSASATESTDYEGNPIIDVTIVLQSDSQLRGEKPLATISAIRRELQKAGVPEFPLVHFATEGEEPAED